MSLLGKIESSMTTTGSPQRDVGPAAGPVRLAQPGQALRAPADDPPRLQPHEQAPVERIVLRHHGHARPGLPQRRRQPLPGRAELRGLHFHPAAPVGVAAVGADEQRRQRDPAGLTAFYGYSRFGSDRTNRARRASPTRAGSRSTSMPTSASPTGGIERPDLARGADLQHRREPDVAARRPHVTLGGSVLINTSEENGKQVVPGINLGFNTNNDPAVPLFNTTNFPGASSGQLTDARALYALLTGRVGAVTGQAALDPETNEYTAFGTRVAGGQDRRLRRVPAGFLEGHAGADPHGRPSLGRPDAVLGEEQHDVRRDAGERVRHVGARRRRDVQQVQLPGARIDGRGGPGVHPAQDGHQRLRDRLEQPRPLGQRRVAAERAGRASCGRSWATPTRRRCAPAGRLPTSARGWGSSPASTGRTRAAFCR